MKQTPFLALSRMEQNALLGVLRQAGVKLPTVCASRQELQDGPSGAALVWITVTGSGWCRSYRSLPGWEGDLALDLLARRSALAVRDGGVFSVSNAAPGAGA